MAEIKQIVKKLVGRHWIWSLIFFIIAVSLLSFLLTFSELVAKEIERLESVSSSPKRIGPVYAKGIYITSWTASENTRIDKLIDFVLRTELNTVVIDIKDSSGKIAYDSKIPYIDSWGTKEIRIENLDNLLKKFHSRGIYTIARIVVFRDPMLANKRPDLALKHKRDGSVWKDWSGLS